MHHEAELDRVPPGKMTAHKGLGFRKPIEIGDMLFAA
jgi:hypothetical protein